MNIVDIYRKDGSFFTSVKPDESSVQKISVMQENSITLAFDDIRYLEFKIGDYCTVFGQKYILSKNPTFTKKSDRFYSYAVVMNSEAYELVKVNYLFLGADNSLRETDFSLMGTADDFINLLISNMNRDNTGWTKGQVIPSGYKNLTFTAQNCYNALSRIAEEFGTEFSVEGKTVHLVKRTSETSHTFRNGKKKGLYEITSQPLSNSNIITRLYAYGSDKNLPENYINTKGKRLRLPAGYNPCLIADLTCSVDPSGPDDTAYTFEWTKPLSPGVTAVSIEYRLAGSADPWMINTGSQESPRTVIAPNGTYEWRFRSHGGPCGADTSDVIEITGNIIDPVFVFPPRPYIERNVDEYGVIEYVQIFEEIYPHRTGTVTGVNAADEFEFTDADIDFDVNSQLLPGLTAKVTFNTGQLAGYTFNIQSFNNSLKRFKILRNADEQVLVIPGLTIRPAIGDKYVLIDIKMPDSYIKKAEEDLMAAAQAKLLEISEPQLFYTVVLDPSFVKSRNVRLKTGDLVWIVDTILGIQKKIRVVSVTRNIVNEDKYDVELSNIVSPGTISLLISSQNSTDRDLADLASHVANNSVLNNNVIGTLTFTGMPTTTTETGFSHVLIEDATGKLHRKV